MQLSMQSKTFKKAKNVWWKMFETSIPHRRREKYTKYFATQRQNSFVSLFFMFYPQSNNIHFYSSDYNSCIITIFETQVVKTKTSFRRIYPLKFPLDFHSRNLDMTALENSTFEIKYSKRKLKKIFKEKKKP